MPKEPSRHGGGGNAFSLSSRNSSSINETDDGCDEDFIPSSGTGRTTHRSNRTRSDRAAHVEEDHATVNLMLVRRTEVDHSITGANRRTGVTPGKGRGHNIADQDVAFQHRAKSCTGHPVHRLAPDGKGGFKDRTSLCYLCGTSTKYYCIGCTRYLCFGGVGGKSPAKRIEKIKKRMEENHPHVASLGSDTNHPPATVKEIGEDDFIFNCCFYEMHDRFLDVAYLNENNDDGSGSSLGVNLDQRLAEAS